MWTNNLGDCHCLHLHTYLVKIILRGETGSKCPKDWSTCFKMLQGLTVLLNALKEQCEKISNVEAKHRCFQEYEEIWPKVFKIIYSPHAAAPAVCHLLEVDEGNCDIFKIK